MSSDAVEAAASITPASLPFRPLERPPGYPRQLEYEDSTLIGTSRRKLTYRVSEGEPIFACVLSLLRIAETLAHERDELLKKVAALELGKQVDALGGKPRKKGD